MNQAPEPSPPQRGRLIPSSRAWLGGAILFLLVTIVYWPTVEAGFGDSSDYIEHNPAIRTLGGLEDIWFKVDATSQYMPLVFSTFWVEYHLWELDPRGYHVVNFLLHGAVAVLVWWLLARLEVPGAWLAAAIWAVHPIGVDAVAMLHQRKKELTCLFALASLLAYLRFSPPESADDTSGHVPIARGRWGYYVLAFVMYVASLLGNAETAFGPAVLLVIYWWKRGWLTWRDVAQTVPFFVVGWALYGVTIWREMALIADSGQSWNFSLLERMLLAGRILWFYAGKLAWPHRLMVIYPQWVIDSHVWWQYLFPAAALAVLVGLWLARTRIGRGPLAAALIFAGLLAPGLGFIDFFVFQIMFVGDHFQYHASIALIALTAAVAVQVGARLPSQARWLGLLASAGLLLPLAVASHQRTHVYKNEATIREDMLAKLPDSWQRHYALGTSLKEEGKYDEALSHFRQAIELQELLVRDNPTRSIYQHDLAFLYGGASALQHAMGQFAERERSLHKAIDIREKLARDNPKVRKYQDDLAKGYAGLARIQRETGRPDDGAVLLHKAIEIRQKLAQDNPTVGKLQNNLAMSYADLGIFQRDMGQPDEAASAFRRAIDVREKLLRDNPTFAEYQAGLAASYEDLAISQKNGGRGAEAAASRRKAIEIREKLARDAGELTVLRLSDEIETRQNLTENSLLMSEYQNDLAASYVDLGLLDREMGRLAEAESSFRKATEIREKLVRDHPAISEYQDGLAWCYVDFALIQRQTARLFEAAASHRKVIEIREKLARDNPTVGLYANQLAGCYVDAGLLQREMGQPAEAQRAFRKAIEIREKLVRENSTASDYQDGLAWCYAHLASAQYQAAQPSAAEASCRKLIQIRENLVQDYPAQANYQHQLAVDYRDLGNLQRATGRIADAIVAYRSAVAVREWLVRDYPNNADELANLASDLALCGDTLALLGKWSESADLYAQAVKAGDYSWQTLGQCALVQLAAGNEAGYRATCAELVRRHAGAAAADVAFSIALTTVVGEGALPNMSQALQLAERAAAADPSNPVSTILVGAAQFRAGRGPEAIATLTGALSRLEPATTSVADKPEQIFIGRLVGAMILAQAYHDQADREAPQQQLASLRALIDKAEASAPQSSRGLPPWAARCVVEIAKRELAKLHAGTEAPSAGP